MQDKKSIRTYCNHHCDSNRFCSTKRIEDGNVLFLIKKRMSKHQIMSRTRPIKCLQYNKLFTASNGKINHCSDNRNMLDAFSAIKLALNKSNWKPTLFISLCWILIESFIAKYFEVFYAYVNRLRNNNWKNASRF